MADIAAGLVGSVGTVAFFAFVSFAVWIDYRKKKDERAVAHQERMKALELGFAPPDAEIERAKAYASAAWAAGVIGLVVPIVVVSLTGAGSIVAVIFRESGENLVGPLIAAWSIAAFITLVTVVRCLGTIRQLSRPTTDTSPRQPAAGLHKVPGSSEFQEKRLEL
jgi:hypothetical protein